MRTGTVKSTQNIEVSVIVNDMPEMAHTGQGQRFAVLVQDGPTCSADRAESSRDIMLPSVPNR